MAKGRATVIVPLSLDTQAAQMEEGKETGKRKRRRKRSMMSVKQARQREGAKGAACPPSSFFALWQKIFKKVPAGFIAYTVTS